ncbi:phage tail protein [Mannheimia massilioguelmaensis]|uniref:phage tail protein n=1 Tax=Mannheimia massilioguelmaensis TaxID=1604354 RepID=UPI0006985D10|nr:phage tail protein [Mannheimia massilioguelmaensis]
MYALDNKSGVAVMPKIQKQVFDARSPQWFTEGGNGVSPSYPGADWFNVVQAELLNILKAGGITPDKSQLNQLALAIQKIIVTQYPPYAGYDSNNEKLYASAKAINTLKGFIDSNTRSFANYIPNGKKSNAVDSNSADTVATTLAVKTAYDLANTKVSKSGDTMTDVLIFDTNNWAQTKYTTQGGIWRFEVHPTGDLATNTARFNYVFVDKTGAERSRIAFNQSVGTSIVAYQGWIADNYLPLTGGLLSGEVSLPTLKVTSNNTGKGIEIGDDATIADVKLSNGIGIIGKQQTNKGYVGFGYNTAASKPLAYIGYDGNKLVTSNILYQGDTKYALVTDIPNITSEAVYASHYNGAKVLKIKTNTNTGWKIIKMQVDKMTVPGDGVLTLNLPEATTTDAVVSAIDNGTARFGYGGKMDGTNKIKIYAPQNAIVGLNIIIIGGL